MLLITPSCATVLILTSELMEQLQVGCVRVSPVGRSRRRWQRVDTADFLHEWRPAGFLHGPLLFSMYVWPVSDVIYI